MCALGRRRLYAAVRKRGSVDSERVLSRGPPDPVEQRRENGAAESATSTVTFAAVVSEKPSSATSPWPSPFGVMPSGTAATSVIAKRRSRPGTCADRSRRRPCRAGARSTSGTRHAAERRVPASSRPALPGTGSACDLGSGARHRDRPRESVPRAERGTRTGPFTGGLDPRVEDLRPTELRRGLRRDGVEPRVELVARARREPGVPVAGDRPQETRGSRPRSARFRRRSTFGRTPSGSTCATSSRQARSDVSAFCAAAVGAVSRVRPEQRDADRARVEAPRMRADDRLVDASVAPFVDRAEAIDEKVVADVVPAVALHVVQLDSLHDRGSLGLRVRVAAGRVVHRREADSRRVRRAARAGCSRWRPRSARHDRGLRSRRRSAERHLHRRAPDEVRTDSADTAQPLHLDAVGGPTHHGLPIRHALRARDSSDPRVRPVLLLRRRRRQALQSPAKRAGAEHARVPGPRQWTPTSVNLPVAAEAARPRLAAMSELDGGHRCLGETRRGASTPPATTSGRRTARRRRMMSRVAPVRFARKPREPCVDAILTACVTPLCAGLAMLAAAPRPGDGGPGIRADGGGGAASGARRAPRQRHQPGDAGVHRGPGRACRGRRVRRVRPRARYSRRPQLVDAGNRQALPRRERAGRRLRRAARLECRLRRSRHHDGLRSRRDGAADEHRLVDPDLARAARTSRTTCAGRSSTTRPRTSASSRASTTGT